MKRIAICMDGTWQSLPQRRKNNINIIARSVAHQDAGGVHQIVIYTAGVGSTLNAMKGRTNWLLRLATNIEAFLGGAFGDGLENTILETYLRLAFNYEPGDEIYIFGFSRGAFAARSLAGLIEKCGVVSRVYAEQAQAAFALYRDPDVVPDSTTAIEFRMRYGKRVTEGGIRRHADHRPQIAYLGVFDTVGQRGLPSALGILSRWLNERFAFHSLDLGAHVQAARQALAIDERRKAFPVARWENLEALNAAAGERRYQQQWFAGVHGDIGGGRTSTLSAFPLQWVVEGAEAAGLKMDRSPNSPLAQALAEENLDVTQPVSRPSFPETLLPINWTGRWRSIHQGGTPPTEADMERLLHYSVSLKFAAIHPRRYRPRPLRPFLPLLLQRTAPIRLVGALVQRLARLERKKAGPPPTETA